MKKERKAAPIPPVLPNSDPSTKGERSSSSAFSSNQDQPSSSAVSSNLSQPSSSNPEVKRNQASSSDHSLNRGQPSSSAESLKRNRASSSAARGGTSPSPSRTSPSVRSKEKESALRSVPKKAGSALKAVIYARKSSDDRKNEDQSLSVSEQIAACEGLAKSCGYKIVGTFTDEGISGRCPPAGYESIFESDEETQAYIAKMRQKTRPGFGEVCKRIEGCEVDLLLCRDMTRIARPKFLSTLINWIPTLLRKHKVKVHSVTEGLLDPSNQQQMMFSIIRDAMIDDEITRRAHLSVKTKVELKKKGLYGGRPPYGFRQEDGKYTHHEKEAEAIKLLFAMRAKGSSFHAIANEFETRGIRRTDGKQFYQSQLAELTTKPVYAGLIDLGSTDSHDFIEATNIKGIVKKETFLKCLGLHETNREKFKGRPRAAGGSFLSGLVVCGYCGSGMCRCTSGGRILKERRQTILRYACNQRRLSNNCKTACSIKADDLEAFMVNFLLLKTARQEAQLKEYSTKRAELPKLVEQLAALRKKRFALLQDNRLDAEFIAEAGAELGKQIADLQRQVNTIKTLPAPRTNKTSGLEELGKLPSTEKRDILREYIQQVKVFKDKLEIHFATGEQLTVERILSKLGKASKLPRINAIPAKGGVEFHIESPTSRKTIIGTDFTVFREAWKK